jgi:hypothetical protein
MRFSLLMCAVIAVLPAAQAAQTCTQKFANLTTCTMFNGVFASGNDASLSATKFIEPHLMLTYDTNRDIYQNDECKTRYRTFICIGTVSKADFMAAGPCSSNGARLKMCRELCVNFYRRCGKGWGIDNLIDLECADMSAPEGDECFGDAGVLGMKSAGHKSVPPFFAVAFLALAVCLVTDFKRDVY